MNSSDSRSATVIIEPVRGIRSLGLQDLWSARELLYFMLWRDVKGNYRQMAFGPLWMLIQPLVMMLIFTGVFGTLANLPSEGVPYPLFTYVALLPWQFFATGTRQSAQSLVSQQSVISKVYFPRLIIPVSAVLAAFVDFLSSFVILIGMLLFYRVQIGWQVLALPVFIVLAGATALTVGLWLAGLAVKYRDVLLGLGFLITVWQYLTPVAYSATLIPEHLRSLYMLNPMAVTVQGFRWSLLGIGDPPGWPAAASGLLVTALLLGGLITFRRTERTIVDLL
ncbi:MAG: ABC transporter permease [Ardenticatenia bacterium]|nr:ABC transporter permease [Ardenticatenia bacterium]